MSKNICSASDIKNTILKRKYLQKMKFVIHFLFIYFSLLQCVEQEFTFFVSLFLKKSDTLQLIFQKILHILKLKCNGIIY